MDGRTDAFKTKPGAQALRRIPKKTKNKKKHTQPTDHQTDGPTTHEPLQRTEVRGVRDQKKKKRYGVSETVCRKNVGC